MVTLTMFQLHPFLVVFSSTAPASAKLKVEVIWTWSQLLTPLGRAVGVVLARECAWDMTNTHSGLKRLAATVGAALERR